MSRRTPTWWCYRDRQSRFAAAATISEPGSICAGACLIWGDVWFPGRYARDELSELYQFERLIQDLQICRAGELIFRDRFAWHGPWDTETRHWHTGPGLATGSLFLTGGVDEPSRIGTDSLERSVLPLPSGDTCIRWCGDPAELVRDLVATALTQAARNEPPGLSRRPSSDRPTPWLLGTNNLGPTHWFS